MSGVINRAYQCADLAASSGSWSASGGACVLATCPLSSRYDTYGVMMNATPSEASIANDAPTGMGRMYGPIIPDTNAMGRMAAVTVNVARMVGLPTSSTASM